MKKTLLNTKNSFGVQGFVCQHCSSEFETDEYEITKSYTVGEWSFFKGYKYNPCYEFSSECPVCERNTRVFIPTGEKPWWQRGE